MKMKRSGLFVLGALVALGAADLTAQAAPADRRAPRRGPNAEGILALRERLELTDAQIASLDAIRSEAVQRRNAERNEVEEMRSRLRARQIRASEMMAFMEERRDAMTGRSDERRAEIESILTEAQMETLGQMRRSGRAAAAAIRERRDIRAPQARRRLRTRF
jgi:hypothetical protein